MGWGLTRLKVYDLLLRLTRQALEGEDSRDGKPVRKPSIMKLQMLLTLQSASEGARRSMDGGDD